MTAIEPETGYAVQQSSRSVERSLPWRVAGGLKTFAKRSPLSAFCGGHSRHGHSSTGDRTL
jgi:hypothetical protein